VPAGRSFPQGESGRTFAAGGFCGFSRGLLPHAENLLFEFLCCLALGGCAASESEVESCERVGDALACVNNTAASGSRTVTAAAWIGLIGIVVHLPDCSFWAGFRFG